MNNSNAPEHDEKTGSFAPRTSGADESARPQKKSHRPKIIAGALIAIIGTTLAWWRPWQNAQTESNAPRSFFFSAVNALNEEESGQGQGSAAEPPIEIRQAAERELAELKKLMPELEAVITPCVLTGHDVHLIDPTGRVLTHVMTDEEIPVSLSGVRELIAKLPPEAEPVILVRGKLLEAYSAQGEPLTP